jgi:hypothetical protein
MTHDRSPFERPLAARLERMAGPEPHVDVAASVRAATTSSPRWRFPHMFSVTKLFVAGAVVAAFGGYLVLDVVDPSGGDVTPGAAMAGASCPEAAALLEARDSGSPADPSIVSRIRMEPFGEDGTVDEASTLDESDGYGRVGFPIEGIPVEAEDERLVGTFSGDITAHFFTEGEGYMIGPIAIDNEAGSWSGQVRGHIAEGAAQLTFELVGDGAYAGCAVSLHGGFDGPFDGIVFPALAIGNA